jgi:hypothetical protein
MAVENHGFPIDVDRQRIRSAANSSRFVEPSPSGSSKGADSAARKFGNRANPGRILGSTVVQRDRRTRGARVHVTPAGIHHHLRGDTLVKLDEVVVREGCNLKCRVVEPAGITTVATPDCTLNVDTPPSE